MLKATYYLDLCVNSANFKHGDISLFAYKMLYVCSNDVQVYLHIEQIQIQVNTGKETFGCDIFGKREFTQERDHLAVGIVGKDLS